MANNSINTTVTFASHKSSEFDRTSTHDSHQQYDFQPPLYHRILKMQNESELHSRYRSCPQETYLPNLPSKVFASTGLERQSGLAYKVNTINDKPAFSVVNEKQPIVSAVRTLPWKISEYQPSPSHCFTSRTPKRLDSKIRELLRDQKVSFAVDQSDSLCYVCEKPVQGAVYKFKIYISSLLKSCQVLLGKSLLVEITRNGAAGASQPVSWKKLKDQILCRLSDDEKPKLASNVENHKTALSLFDTESNIVGNPKRRVWSNIDHGIHLNPITAFIDLYNNVEPNIENEEVAVTLSQMATDMHKPKRRRTMIAAEGWETLLSLLHKGSIRFKTAVCTILSNEVQSADEIERKRFEQAKAELVRVLRADVYESSPIFVSLVLETLELLKEKARPFDLTSILDDYARVPRLTFELSAQDTNRIDQSLQKRAF